MKVYLHIVFFVLTTVFLFVNHVFAQEQQQVNVSVKIIEFQTSKGTDSGLSSYFKQRVQPQPYGQVETGKGIITALSTAYPSQSTSGITLFLDRISTYYGDFEVILEALVKQNRAFILSQPKVMVPVASAVPTIIKTTQEVPYENTVVVGATAVKTTAFRPTGVMLTVNALQIVQDDDGDPDTEDAVFIQLSLNAEVNDEAISYTIAMDEGNGLFAGASEISVPSFTSRSMNTTVWVRNGETLILGGLYRNTKYKNVSTLPWLTQGENMMNNIVNRVSPLSETPKIPLASSLGSKNNEEGRRELVFLVKADIWRKAYTVSGVPSFFEMEESEGEGESEIITPKSSPRFIEGLIDTFTDDDFSAGVSGSLGGRD